MFCLNKDIACCLNFLHFTFILKLNEYLNFSNMKPLKMLKINFKLILHLCEEHFQIQQQIFSSENNIGHIFFMLHIHSVQIKGMHNIKEYGRCWNLEICLNLEIFLLKQMHYQFEIKLLAL